jgi:hypothetical protein
MSLVQASWRASELTEVVESAVWVESASAGVVSPVEVLSELEEPQLARREISRAALSRMLR